MIRHTNPMGRFIILNGLRLTIHGFTANALARQSLKKDLPELVHIFRIAVAPTRVGGVEFDSFF